MICPDVRQRPARDRRPTVRRDIGPPRHRADLSMRAVWRCDGVVGLRWTTRGRVTSTAREGVARPREWAREVARGEE